MFLICRSVVGLEPGQRVNIFALVFFRIIWQLGSWGIIGGKCRGLLFIAAQYGAFCWVGLSVQISFAPDGGPPKPKAPGIIQIPDVLAPVVQRLGRAALS